MHKGWLIASGCVVGLFIFIFFTQTPALRSTNNAAVEHNENQTSTAHGIIDVVKNHKQAEVPVLIYHNVREATGSDSEYDRQFIVSPSVFEEQLTFLRENHFVTISFDDLFDFLEFGKPLPEHPVILTFDDGVRNHYQTVFPLLKQFGFTATFFVFTNAMDKNDNYITWAELKEMSVAGMVIGSHSRLHPYLNRENSLEVLRSEIVGSKEDIEKHLGVETKYFAYPFGEYDEETIQLVTEAGYRGARDILHGMIHELENRYKLNGYFVPTDLEGIQNLLK